jgi:Rrf2 family protein
MHISKKAEYALRAMVALARRAQGPPALIEDVSAAEHIPMKFLEQILLALRKADLLRSKRGVGGGYHINHAPQEISLGDVVRVIDGPFEPMACTRADPERFGRQPCACGVAGGCGLGAVFTDLQKSVNAFLAQTTLADVLARESKPDGFSFEI